MSLFETKQNLELGTGEKTAQNRAGPKVTDTDGMYCVFGSGGFMLESETGCLELFPHPELFL